MHRPRSVIYFLVACANVGISVLLIRRWGVVGTSLGTLLAVLAGHGIFMNLYYHFRIGLNVVTFWKTILRWTVPAAGLCAAYWLLIRSVQVRTWGMLLALAAGYAILYAGLLWLIGLRKEEKAWVRSKAGRMLPFLRRRS
jgi:O-antigen/teichoic acid export membrane protein